MATRLRALRISSGETLEQASHGIGIGATSLWRLENGYRVDAPASSLLKIADYYDVSTDWLLCRKGYAA